MVPWLSIWLLACNGSSYLTDSIEAVLDQSYEDSELIISDYYPSTDSTPGPTIAAKDATHGFAMSTSRATQTLSRATPSSSGTLEVNS